MISYMENTISSVVDQNYDNAIMITQKKAANCSLFSKSSKRSIQSTRKKMYDLFSGLINGRSF